MNPDPDEDFCRWCGAEIVRGQAIQFSSMPFDSMQCVTEYRNAHGTKDSDDC